MTTKLDAFFNACKIQEQQERTETFGTFRYVFTQDDLRPVRVFLVNLDQDEPQEEFLLDQIKSKDHSVEIDSHIVDHLKEYLKGAIK
jgi:hypothetical protein